MKLLAQSAEDLTVMSSLMQDATVRTGDIDFTPKAHRLTFVANRFRWEKKRKFFRPKGERVRTGLHMNGILKVQAQGLAAAVIFDDPADTAAFHHRDTVRQGHQLVEVCRNQQHAKAAFGDIGVRVIKTNITSLGISRDLETSPGDDPGEIDITPVGPATVNTETNDFWNVLPSANLGLELNPDLLLRLAVYKAIARPDPEAMSAALSISDESDAQDVGQAISAAGSPYLEPLKSWNGDLSLEWYAADTTAISLAAYYKSLQTGFDTDVSTISVVVDGTPTDVQIARTVNSDDKSRIFGFELTAQHKFDFGLGFQASYNFADSNFEFPDPTIGRNGETLAVFIENANLPGYSKHSLNATMFYETGPFNARLAYKWRSRYFKPYRSTSNRFAAEQGFLDFSTSYDLTKNLEVRFQVLNILDEPNLLYRPTRDSLAQSDFSGRRYFLGLRGRF
ncbi:MAG: TonB-dependent receptor [Citromicrobium sp.]|nr:TonB-dependent receptor [Citromicrobium sp.]